MKIEHDFRGEALKELDDILLDFCDYDCAKTHLHDNLEHDSMRNVVKERLTNLIKRLTIRVSTQ